jgi:DNA-directed RNA polymerase specialized sigma24 family protein
VARLGTLQGEDVAQEVFVAAWEGLPAFVPRPDLPLDAWLVGIARNKCLDASRTRRRRRELAMQFLADITHYAHAQSPASAEDAMTLAQRRCNRALHRLRERMHHDTAE